MTDQKGKLILMGIAAALALSWSNGEDASSPFALRRR